MGVDIRMRPAVSCSQLREWVRGAQANARIVYAHGACASTCCPATLRELVRELARKGYLTAHTAAVGEAGVKVQIVQRTARPILKGAVL